MVRGNSPRSYLGAEVSGRRARSRPARVLSIQQALLPFPVADARGRRPCPISPSARSIVNGRFCPPRDSCAALSRVNMNRDDSATKGPALALDQIQRDPATDVGRKDTKRPGTFL